MKIQSPLPAVVLTIAVLTGSCLSSLGTAHADELARGKALVELNCSPCHAVGAADASRHADAPPLRDLSNRYPIDALEEAFVEGISTGHPDMPEFVASPDQVAAILDYIASLPSR